MPFRGPYPTTQYTSSYSPTQQYPGRWFSPRDLGTQQSFASELWGYIVQTIVWCYKVAPMETQTNIYGETDQKSGRFYFPPVEITAFIGREKVKTEENTFGPDKDQTQLFVFREAMLQRINYYPQVGDLILFNERYHEVDNIEQEHFQGGQAEKSIAINVNTHYSRFSKINILDRQN